MTGTAANSGARVQDHVYGLKVEDDSHQPAGDSHRSPDVVFPTKAEKERAVLEEIRRAHANGQPVLVGTASVAESERLSRCFRTFRTRAQCPER